MSIKEHERFASEFVTTVLICLTSGKTRHEEGRNVTDYKTVCPEG